MNPKNEIFEKKKISKVENKLNLNQDEINYFWVETDPNQSQTRGAMWAKSLRLKLKVENHIRGEKSRFSAGKKNL